MINKVLITGITGKSGLFMLQEMVKNADKLSDYQFRVSVRSSSDTKHIDEAPLSIEKYVGNLDDDKYLDQLTNFKEEHWTLVHIAGIEKSLKLVKFAIKHNVNRLILVHTTGIYSKYKAAGQEYRQIESEIYRLAKENNIFLTILRPTMIYGTKTDHNISIFVKIVDTCKIIPTVNGAHYELQPVHCSDLGKAYYQVLMNPDKCNGHDYNLSGGAPIELRQLFEEIAKNLGVKRRYISCPFPIAYAGAWVIYLCTLRKIDFREKVQRLCEPRTFSYEEAANDFGYTPKTFQEGIVQEIKDYLLEKSEKLDRH